ncbi:MAG: hypothetical protein Q8914_03620 [Bacteroidota bacterium]|nr:hypothetical protein [Bacteroidota bacterium]
MRYKYNCVLIILFVLLLFTGRLSAQTVSYTAGDQITLQVQDYSLIDTNHAPVSLTLSTSVAGAPITSVSNADMYVKVSSIVPGGTDREISARLSSGTVPAGTKLTLVAAPCTTANSGGVRGTPVATPIVLTTTDQFIVTGIASCYTGIGYNDGYRLTFTWSRDTSTDYSLIHSSSTQSTVTLILTLTAHDGN